MKILVITQRWYPDTFGGSEHVAFEQSKGLANLGHEVFVLTEYNNSSLPAFEEKKFNQGFIKIFRYGQENFFKKWGSSLGDLLTLPKALKKILSQEKFDVAILHHPYPALAFFLSKPKIPALYVFHASTAREAEVEGLRRKFQGFLKPFGSLFAFLFIKVTRLVEKIVLKKSKKIVLFSEFSKKVLQETYPQREEKIQIVPIGIDLEKFKPSDEQKEIRKKLGLPEDREIILTVRRLTLRMGLFELLSAALLVRQNFPKVLFLIIGEGPLKEALVNEIEQLNLKFNVWLLGRVPLEDLPLYYQAADLFVLPTAAFEGLGMATLEALSSGLPVVGTAVGATPEILSQLDLRLIVEEPKPALIAQGIVTYLNQTPEEKQNLRKKARNLAEKQYNWPKAVEELEKILSNLSQK